MLLSQTYVTAVQLLSDRTQDRARATGLAVLGWRFYCFRFMLGAGLVKHYGSSMWRDGT